MCLSLCVCVCVCTGAHCGALWEDWRQDVKCEDQLRFNLVCVLVSVVRKVTGTIENKDRC